MSITIKIYRSNYELWINERNFSFSTEQCEDYTLKENIEADIETIRSKIEITEEEEKEIINKLRPVYGLRCEDPEKY